MTTLGPQNLVSVSVMRGGKVMVQAQILDPDPTDPMASPPAFGYHPEGTYLGLDHDPENPDYATTEGVSEALLSVAAYGGDKNEPSWAQRNHISGQVKARSNVPDWDAPGNILVCETECDWNIVGDMNVHPVSNDAAKHHGYAYSYAKRKLRLEDAPPGDFYMPFKVSVALPSPSDMPRPLGWAFPNPGNTAMRYRFRIGPENLLDFNVFTDAENQPAWWATGKALLVPDDSQIRDYDEQVTGFQKTVYTKMANNSEVEPTLSMNLLKAEEVGDGTIDSSTNIHSYQNPFIMFYRTQERRHVTRNEKMTIELDLSGS